MDIETQSFAVNVVPYLSIADGSSSVPTNTMFLVMAIPMLLFILVFFRDEALDILSDLLRFIRWQFRCIARILRSRTRRPS